jgi:hypothetical protein
MHLPGSLPGESLSLSVFLSPRSLVCARTKLHPSQELGQGSKLHHGEPETCALDGGHPQQVPPAGPGTGTVPLGA